MPPVDKFPCMGTMFVIAKAVIVGERYVEWIKLWDKCLWAIPYACCGVGVIEAAEVFLPLGIPGAGMVRCGVSGSGFFTYPEDGGSDVFLPRVGDVEGVVTTTWRIDALAHDGLPWAE